MATTASALMTLAQTGCNLYVESEYTPPAIMAIIKVVKAKGGHITINGSYYTASVLNEFAKIGSSNITIKV